MAFAKPQPASTPREVRAALLPEERGQFDSEWRTAMSRRRKPWT